MGRDRQGPEVEPSAPDAEQDGPRGAAQELDDDLGALADEAGRLDDRLGALEAEAHDLRTRLARARADYDNLLKRQARDAELERERVRARFLEGFLQVFEYAAMAEQEAERSPGPLAQGVRMVVQQFRQLLENEGVRTVGAVGEPFDASRHEAVGEEAAEGVAPGHVARVVRTGYLLGDRVLRYAQVAVAPGDGDG